MNDILPTRHCFDDAVELIEARVTEDPKVAHEERLVLVHGICLLPNADPVTGGEKGKPFVHGWVEEGTLVWDSGLWAEQRIYYAAAKDEWYAAMRVQETTRYTIRELFEENQRSGHYGPWVDRYRQLALTKVSAT